MILNFFFSKKRTTGLMLASTKNINKRKKEKRVDGSKWYFKNIWRWNFRVIGKKFEFQLISFFGGFIRFGARDDWKRCDRSEIASLMALWKALRKAVEREFLAQNSYVRHKTKRFTAVGACCCRCRSLLSLARAFAGSKNNMHRVYYLLGWEMWWCMAWQRKKR